jgi:hypothetical protein
MSNSKPNFEDDLSPEDYQGYEHDPEGHQEYQYDPDGYQEDVEVSDDHATESSYVYDEEDIVETTKATNEQKWVKDALSTLEHRALSKGVGYEEPDSTGKTLYDAISEARGWVSGESWRKFKRAFDATLDDILQSIEERDFGLFFWLVSYAGSKNEEISKKGTIMNNAIRTGDINYVKTAYFFSAKSTFDEFPSLHLAIRLGFTEIAEFLLKNDSSIDLSQTDMNGNTALHVAVQKGDDVFVAAFLKHIKTKSTVIDFNIKNKLGQTVPYLVATKAPGFFSDCITATRGNFLQGMSGVSAVRTLIVNGDIANVKQAVLTILGIDEKGVWMKSKTEATELLTTHRFLEFAVVEEQTKIAEFIRDFYSTLNITEEGLAQISAKKPARGSSQAAGPAALDDSDNEKYTPASRETASRKATSVDRRFNEDTERAIRLSLMTSGTRPSTFGSALTFRTARSSREAPAVLSSYEAPAARSSQEAPARLLHGAPAARSSQAPAARSGAVVERPSVSVLRQAMDERERAARVSTARTGRSPVRDGRSPVKTVRSVSGAGGGTGSPIEREVARKKYHRRNERIEPDEGETGRFSDIHAAFQARFGKRGSK